MTGKGLLSKTIILILLFAISIVAQIVINSAATQEEIASKFLASIHVMRN